MGVLSKLIAKPSGRLISAIVERARSIQSGLTSSLSRKENELRAVRKALAELKVKAQTLAEEKDGLREELAASRLENERIKACAGQGAQADKLLQFAKCLKREVFELRQENMTLKRENEELRHDLHKLELRQSQAEPRGQAHAAEDDLEGLQREVRSLRAKVESQERLIHSLKEAELKLKSKTKGKAGRAVVEDATALFRKPAS